VASRRLIDDRLYDRPGLPIQGARCALRIRRDGSRGILTFKGPPQKGLVKIREEFETEISDVVSLEAIVHALGFAPFFRAQKWREEYDIAGAKIAVDDTPMGVFLEIEAESEAIAQVTTALGRTQSDWMLESYMRLFANWAAARGLPADAMLFD
jgi:adenylate cyclase class 2